jgi:hypothetical protein
MAFNIRSVSLDQEHLDALAARLCEQAFDGALTALLVEVEAAIEGQQMLLTLDEPELEAGLELLRADEKAGALTLELAGVLDRFEAASRQFGWLRI